MPTVRKIAIETKDEGRRTNGHAVVAIEMDTATDTNDLPQGWRWSKLGKVSSINARDSILRDLPDSLPVTFVPMAAVDADSGLIQVAEQRVLGTVRKGYTSFSEGDVIFAKITPCMENGKAAIARGLTNGRGLGSTEFHVLKPQADVLPEWVFYFVRQESFRQDAKANFTGTAGQLRVPARFLEAYPVPVPPLAEQHRIVEALEQQLTRLDAGVASLRRAQAGLRRYKAAVLKAACEGRLVPQDSGDEPAEALLRRILDERRAKWEVDQIAKMQAQGRMLLDDGWRSKYQEPHGQDTTGLLELPKGWQWSTIDQVAECLDYKRVPINKKERETRVGEIPYYGANGQVGWIDDYLFDEPLILVVEDETFTGREKPFSYKITGKTWVNNHAHVLRSAGAVDIDYLNYSLAYYPFTPLTTGTTGRKKLTQQALMSAPYALPPLAEQQRIVAEVEAAVAANLKRAERLRQAILKRAFEGKLVPQDPSDEPARCCWSGFSGRGTGR